MIIIFLRHKILIIFFVISPKTNDNSSMKNYFDFFALINSLELNLQSLFNRWKVK